MEIVFISHAVGAFFFLILLAVQIHIWNRGSSSAVMMAATLVTFLWCLTVGVQPNLPVRSFYLLISLETVKNICWFALLLSILGLRNVIFKPAGIRENKGLAAISLISLGVPLAVLLRLLYNNLFAGAYSIFPTLGGSWLISGFLLVSIVGLVLLEQVIRNTRHYQRWHLKFLCLGLGFLFGYDLYLYSDALLFGRIQDSIWEARGFVYAFASLLLLISVLRTNQQPIQVNVSRRLVFHTGMLLATGIYLLAMASAGFYIRSNAGEAWGGVLQALFWILALGLLFALMFSGRLRSLIKVYISRNLFSSKYDYREEWLKLSRALSRTDGDDSLPQRSVRAMADIVDSPGGALWLTRDEKHYDQIAEVEMGWVENGHLTSDHPLVQFLQEQNRIVEIGGEVGEKQNPPPLPPWLTNWQKVWLLIPLVLHEKLLGFMLLRQPRVKFQLNWEDFDVLKTAAQQTASYLAQMTASEALSEARQFSAYNQMSAFVVHDLKTLNSQLSLLVDNAGRHKTNPSFVDDMIKTVEHAVQKMDFLLQHFRQENQVGEAKESASVDLVGLVQQVAESQKHLKPLPRVETNHSRLPVLADEQELKSAIAHLVKNAQEATDNEGSVSLVLEAGDDKAVLSIRDTGPGMSQEFIQTRLFRPFESTKGLSGMGVGVYQTREYVRKLGGDLQVSSQPGKGTEFLLTLDIAVEEEALAG